MEIEEERDIQEETEVKEETIKVSRKQKRAAQRWASKKAGTFNRLKGIKKIKRKHVKHRRNG
jgi:hypothetical protein